MAEHGRAPKILVVDDEAVLRDALVLALTHDGLDAAAAPDISTTGILEAATRERPDLVLLDFNLDKTVSLPLVDPLRRLGAHVVMLTSEDDAGLLAACLDAGAEGIIAKSIGLGALVRAVEDTLDGRSPMRAGAAEELRASARRATNAERTRLAPFDALSPREQVVLRGLMAGKTADEIAAAEFVSLPTVRSQIRGILLKLGVNNQLAAVARARDAGWS